MTIDHDKQSIEAPCGPLPEVLATRVGYLLNRSALRIRQMTEENLQPLGIVPKHYGVMAVIHANGAMTQQALGDILKIDRTTMVLLVDDAEQKGLVTRGPHPTDRRCHLLSLSPEGKKIYKKAQALVEKAEETFFNVLPEEDKGHLVELLGKLFQPPTTEHEKIAEKAGLQKV